MKEILISVVSMTAMSVIFAGVLAWADKVFSVEKDSRVEEIIEALPGANCGACGFAGCAAFAEAVAKGEAPVNGCPVGRQKVADMISEIMGINSQDEEARSVARLICNGSEEAAKTKMVYHGIQDCRAATLINGGDKSCPYGCIGLETCVRACPFNAITMASNGLPNIDEELCTGCTKCVAACPKNVLTMLPISSEVRVACNSHARGPEVIKACKVGCIGCTKCVKACPEEAISMVDKLAVIDPHKCTNCGVCIEVCPTNSIVRV